MNNAGIYFSNYFENKKYPTDGYGQRKLTEL